MKIITICNHKGGTGKTTTVIHVAAALGLAGHKTLAIDLDPQGFLTRTLGIAEPAEDRSSLVLFDAEASSAALPVQHLSGFDILPASTTLTKHMRRLNKPTDVLWVRESLAAEHGYDYVLLDTAAAVTVYSLSALVAAKSVLIPVTPEYQPVIGAEQTYQTCGVVREKLNPSLNNPRFLLTRVDGRKRSHTMYRQYIRKTYTSNVFQAIIRTSTSLSETSGDGTTVFDRDISSRGARDYAAVTDELLRFVEADEIRSRVAEEFSPSARAV